MSENCGNPNCPQHGSTEEAKLNRETRARILTNGDLMDIIRTIAVNAETEMIRKMGINMNDPIFKLAQMQMLQGNSDDHPTVQGVINGFVTLLKTHRPTQEFYAATQQVPESEFFMTKQRQAARERAAQAPQAPREGLTMLDLLALLMAGKAGG